METTFTVPAPPTPAAPHRAPASTPIDVAGANARSPLAVMEELLADLRQVVEERNRYRRALERIRDALTDTTSAR